MVIKVLVADDKQLLEGELRALEAHFPSDQLVIDYSASTPENEVAHLETCHDKQPDVVVLTPGFDPLIFLLAKSENFNHLVITSGEVRSFDSYLETREKIQALIP